MELKSIDEGRSFDFGKTSAQYAAYRDIYPAELYARLRELGVAKPGSSWLDLGTGTGVLPKNMYAPGVKIVGADISEEQIAYARKEAEENNRDITYIAAPAEKTGLPSHSFDAVTAAQCFFYFDRDIMKTELLRLTKPGGIFIKIFMNWDITHPIAEKSCELVKKHNPDWTSGSAAIKDMYDDLFPGRITQTFIADLPFNRDSWHGRMLACRGTMASMDEHTLKEWEKDHISFLNGCPDTFTVRHLITVSYFRI
ncbi:MAG: methyltransferase domain-containing protein [Clostridia bacterium]|nr:methyltransferase domain-containing protein [Clostridia bacterium]